MEDETPGQEPETAPDAPDAPETETGQEPATEPPEADEPDDEPDLTPDETRSELDRARKQAARYRTRLRSAEQERDALKAQLAAAQSQPDPQPDPAQEADRRVAQAERRALIAEAAAEAQIPTAALRAFRQLEAAEGDAGVAAALDALKPFLASQGGGPQTPPSDPGRTLSHDEQLAEAEKSGDTRTAMRLKSAKLAALAQKR